MSEGAAYTEDQLNKMTKQEIADLAEKLGYSVSMSLTKSQMVEAFMVAQEV